ENFPEGTTLNSTYNASNLVLTAVVVPVLNSITVTPGDPSAALGLTEQFTAMGLYSDGSASNLTNQVTCASANPAVATISNTAGSQGLASTASQGTSTFTATFGSISGTTTLTVTPPVVVSIAVTPNDPSVAKGLTQQLTSTGTFSDG